MAEYEACILGIKMAVNMNIKELLVIVDSDILINQVQWEWSTKNVKILTYLYYVKELFKRFMKIEFKHVPKIWNEFADALATLSSMIQHLDNNYIDPIEVEIRGQYAYNFPVEDPYGKPWYHDIRRFVKIREYPENATNSQKRALRRLANHSFHNREVMFQRTQDLGLLRCVDADEATKLLEEIHTGMCGALMTGFTLAKKILRAGYFWMTVESDSIRNTQKCHQC
uniref:Uncharacterized protein LOC104216921 n=1 Tax=Nicotiana sylvestris TaxID=4096 RepID=A0A1U7VBE7_NICSY|nr:PREDICTED: uncharacterized protein LOC104216921 [Nicotiana sylvestris]